MERMRLSVKCANELLIDLRYVVIAMEALDQLLMACHSQSIKPFVESFLHMVAKLLESREPDLQVLGTNSVRQWISNILHSSEGLLQ